MAELILASQSPRRQELLRRIGLQDFTVLVSEADESYDPAWTPEELVSRLSARKAAAVGGEEGAGAINNAPETMVFLDDGRLGKPRDEADAFRMLSELSGREHTVRTGVTVRQGDTVRPEVGATAVRFRPLTAEEIWCYIRTGEPMDKAGAYGIQERGALLVEGIRGDYFNVMGLPVLRLGRMLQAFGLDLFTLGR